MPFMERRKARSLRARAGRSHIVALVIFAAVAAAACSSSDTGSSSGADGSSAGSVVPADPFDLLDGSGSSGFDAYTGAPLVVNFFQSTCAPCVAEMPEFEAVHQELDGEVAFLGLNTQDVLEEGRAIVERTGVTYPTGIDATGELWLHFGGLAMPLTAFVDGDGTIVHSHNGPLDESALTALIEEHLT